MKRRISLRLGALLLAAPFVLFGCGGDNTQAPVNHDPQITSVTVSPGSVVAGGSVTITVVASDQDGDALTYAYQPNGGLVTGTGASVTWNAPTTAGSYSVTVTVSDSRGGTATSSANLTVQAPVNHDPQITSVTVSPGSVVAGGSVTITVVASDQDGDALTYAYQPNGGAVTGTGASVTWNAPTTAGPYSVTVTVSDGQGGTATGTGNLMVIAAQTGISGTAQATAGVQIDLRNSRVAIYADYNDWVMDQYVMTTTGTGNEYAVSFSFTGVAPGTYYLDLWKDMDNSASYTAGDLFGFYGTGAWPANINFTPITVLQGQITNIGSIWVLEL